MRTTRFKRAPGYMLTSSLTPLPADDLSTSFLARQQVLLDAPCSGTGVLAKRADLRWRRSPEQVTQLTALQDSLLDAAASLTAPGGLVVYSTCSIERAENQERVTAFLARQGGQFAVEAPPEGAQLLFLKLFSCFCQLFCDVMHCKHDLEAPRRAVRCRRATGRCASPIGRFIVLYC